MSILDIIHENKLKELLNEDNFEIIKRIYNQKINEKKINYLIKEINLKFKNEYIVEEISIGINKNILHENLNEWFYDIYNNKNFIKYKYFIKSKLNKTYFKMIIINDFKNINNIFFILIKFTYFINNSETSYTINFTKSDNCTYFLNNILFEPLFRNDIEELQNAGFYNSSLLFLNPIKLIHEEFKNITDFYYCEK